ncbi:MAG: PP2C family protein-serine/threonine phosphatase, partial [Planctomycetota bacterium]
EGRFVTFVLVILDPATGTIDVVNGGHMSPLFRGADGSFFEFPDDTVGLPVGVVDGYPFEKVSRTMQPGETALIITDGVDEAMNPAGDLFTKDRVKDFLMSGPRDAAELGKSLLKEVRTHAAGRDQNDDITIMTFGRSA